VPILLRGESVGVKQHGGILEQILREVEIECLPADIPSHVDYDVTELTFGKVVRVSDLPHSEKLKFLSEANSMVAHVVSVKEEVVATPEATAEAAAAAPAEPEVIKKGKQEVEEEGAEAAPAEKPEKKEKEKK
jgi:large subunit ribosomal protein L25